MSESWLDSWAPWVRAGRGVVERVRSGIASISRSGSGIAGGADSLGEDAREHTFALSGDRALAVYDRMWRSDPWVHACLLATTLPIRQGRFYVDPPSDSQADQDRAERVGRAILEEQTLVWADVLRQALLMVRYGFSILEKDYEYRDGMQTLRKLDPRHPTTISRWDFGEPMAMGPRRLRGVWQFDDAGREIFLPIETLVVFTNEREGDNWSGRSMLRPMYKPWLLKEELERTNAIAHARWGAGIPLATAPPGVTRNSREWGAARRLLQEIKAGLRAFVQLPHGWVFDLIGGKGGGQGTDVLRSIHYYDEAIATGALALHLKLGGGRSGSRALGQVFESAFYHATQALADYVAEIIDRFVVAELYMMNWGSAERGHFRVGRIHRTDLQALGYLIQSGGLTHDEPLEQSIREAMRLPPAENIMDDDEPPEDDGVEDMEDGEEDGNDQDPRRRARLPASTTGGR